MGNGGGQELLSAGEKRTAAAPLCSPCAANTVLFQIVAAWLASGIIFFNMSNHIIYPSVTGERMCVWTGGCLTTLDICYCCNCTYIHIYWNIHKVTSACFFFFFHVVMICWMCHGYNNMLPWHESSQCVCVGVYMEKVARRGENCRVEFHSGIQMIPAEFSWTCLVHTLAHTHSSVQVRIL